MRRPLALAAWLGLIAAAVLVPPLLGDYGVAVALSLAMWVALAESWIVLSGMTGYVSLGHAVFYGLGAYVGVLLWNTVPSGFAIIAAGIASGGFAVIIGYPALRVRGPYFVMLTFGVAELVKYVVIDLEAGLGVFSRLILGGPSVIVLYYVMLCLAAAATAITFLVGRSRFGYALRAIRENEAAAETIGIAVGRFKLAAFALSAVIPGMVGAVAVARSTYFEPLSAFDPVVSFTMVTMAVIGGSDDLRGPLLGAAFLVGLSELLWANAPQIYMIILGVLLAIFVLFAPEGIAGRLFVPARRAVS
ncbi:MAG TPA: branched-chain amino acid ABC transporter permease [Stellaceae bacterium]|nr:branched-chain amino acid ABC transporter permease [Stellaceae bacterium]